MNKVLYAFAVAALALGLGSASFATTHYGITNNDNPSGNSITVFAAVPLHQGPTINAGPSDVGLGGGYFAAPRITIASGAACVFASNAGNGTISSFKRTGTSLAYVGSYNNGFSGAAYGIGVALSPNGQTLYAAYSLSQNLASWSVNTSSCVLTYGNSVSDPNADYPSPIIVSSDGKWLIESDPNYGYINSFPVNGTTIGTPTVNNLNSLISGCSIGCYPTGADLTAVSGGSFTVVAGNATLSGPYYIIGTISDTNGGLTNANTIDLSSSGLANIESPEFSRAAYTNNAGTVFLGASGFGSGYPAGVAVGTLVNTAGVPSITYDSAYVNSAAYYTGDISVTTVSSSVVGIWNTMYTSSGTNNVCVYRGTGTTVTAIPAGCVANTAYPGGITLSIAAFPGR
jgi:hypothetical protein